MADHTEAPEEAPPLQKSAEAILFLAGIGRDSPLLFRALADDPDKKGKPGYNPIELVGSFEERAQALRRLNDAGYGIFVQVNAADGRGWRAANIVSATCFFADFDGVPLENVARLGLAPHVVVETSPGKRHYYWRVESIPVTQHPALQKRLIALFDSDKSVHDLPRIMRLPGFLHQKQPEAPHLVRVIEARDEPPYALDDFLAALAAAEQAHGVSAEPPRTRAALPISAAGSRPTPDRAAELAAYESALRHSIAAGTLDLGERSAWVRVGIALKASAGENGFPLWVALSSEADGYDGEDDCRKQWDTFRADQPEGKRLTMGTFIATAQAAGWRRPAGGQLWGADRGGGDDELLDAAAGGGKPDVASVIVTQAREAGDEHFLSPDGLPYVTYRRTLPDGTAHRVTARMDHAAYRGVLALRFHTEAGNKAAGKDHINTAISLMEASARAAGAVHPVYLRTAHQEGRVYVSLDQSRGLAVEIDDSAEGWRVVTDPPVRFVEGSRGALPLPERGGTREDFARHFNVDDDGLTCVIAFMLGTFQETRAYPILVVDGEHGGAKSNLGDKALALVDPPRHDRKAARFSMATDERNLHVQAARSSVMFFDNISAITSDVSDQLCRVSTGGASSFRTHNTMDEEQQFAICRPVLVTCIAVPPARTDLLSRSLQVTVRQVEHRRTERAVWRDFDADQGKMLGFLFTAVSAALRNRAKVEAMVEAQELAAPRMADFAVWVEAAHEVLGLELGAFCRLLNAEQAAIQAEAVQGDPFVDGLNRYFSRADAAPLDVTSAELLKLLDGVLPHREWPAVKTIKGRLTRIVQGLRDSGIDVQFRYDAHHKRSRFDIRTNERFVAGEDAAGDNAVGAGEPPFPF